MENPLVKINIDDTNIITRLYDIGPEVAENIVQYREANGFFNEPADLASVKGVSRNLAETLSSQIDWQIPSKPIQKDKTQGVSLSDLIFSFLLLAFLTYIVYLQVGRSFLYQKRSHWLGVWFDCSFLCGALFAAIGVISGTLELWAVNISLKRKFALIKFVSIGGVLVSGASIGLANFFRYQIFGWDQLLKNTPVIFTGLGAAGAALFLIFTSAAIKYPYLVNNKYFTRLFDVIFMLLSVLLLLVSFYPPAGNTAIISLCLAVLGIVCVYTGIVSSRTNQTLLTAIITPWLVIRNDSEELKTSWLKWLNSRLPDPENQKALQQELNQTYPPSRLRTIISLAIVGIGGWTILQALGAIIQWLVGKGLDKIFGDLFSSTKP